MHAAVALWIPSSWFLFQHSLQPCHNFHTSASTPATPYVCVHAGTTWKLTLFVQVCTSAWKWHSSHPHKYNNACNPLCVCACRDYMKSDTFCAGVHVCMKMAQFPPTQIQQRLQPPVCVHAGTTWKLTLFVQVCTSAWTWHSPHPHKYNNACNPLCVCMQGLHGIWHILCRCARLYENGIVPTHKYNNACNPLCVCMQGLHESCCSSCGCSSQ